MNKFTVIATLSITLLTLCGMSDAYAKRFGGGSSFGSRPSYSAPYQRSELPPSRPYSQPQQQQAPAPRQAPNPAMPNRSGLMGMLGGLAMGGLLGGMLAGGGFHGINFLDILVFGAIAFLLYKLFAAKNAASAPSPAYQRTADNGYRDAAPTYQQPEPARGNRAGFNTDILFNKDKSAAPSHELTMPSDFDPPAFLNGAKIAYTHLQKAWDERDLAEIRSLTTDKVFAEIQSQLRASDSDNHTEILKLEAELLEVREVGSELEAVVLFDTIMREDRDAQASQIREVWHFVKAKNSIQPKWFLDGIQQLAD